LTDFLKLGTAQYTFLWDYSLKDSLKQIKELGFRYIELMTTPPHFWPPSLTKGQRKDLRKWMDRFDLELVAINPTFLDINMASPNPGIREESVKQIKQQISLAHDLGATIIVVIIGKRHPLLAPPVEIVWKNFAKEGVIRCVEHAEKKKVIFGLENGPSLFIDRTELMLFVLNEVKSPWLKFVFDIANASMVEPIIPGLERIKDHLIHVHLSDNDGKKWTHSPIGMGTIDFSSIAKKLKEIHFSGVSILETTHAENPKWGIVSSVKKILPLGWRMEKDEVEGVNEESEWRGRDQSQHHR
jgi:sugar phosphate isomerase/epimerase